MNENLITCRNLTVGYDGCRLCENINFTLHAGEYCCVVGPSGIGKSTLVATLMGIEKPVDGEMLYENGLTARDIGCMPQNPELRTRSTVRDIVLEGCLGHTRGFFVGRREKALADENLERLGVQNLAKRPFGGLSGGQKQRVLLARALCSAKRVLILDDPMHGLDAVAKDEMYETIVRLNRDDGIAVLLVDPDAVDGTVLHLSDTQLYCGPVDGYIKTIPGQYYFSGRII